jgi:cellulose synthase/poly-beta-1,6-N-acetylglucosamine synthase-like glycosyltransferase
MIVLFWFSFFCALYAYFLYPLILIFIGRYKNKDIQINKDWELPSVTLLLPAHNEASIIESKLDNIANLNYPNELIKVIVVSDGSEDNTVEIVNNFKDKLNLKVVVIEKQKGKANALNQGMTVVETPIVVFTDASIMLDRDSIYEIIMPFSDPRVGCVSGEDYIPTEQGGEGVYGKYELYLRNKESRIGSIVGASGSFYAQRTQLVEPFVEGLAPDFLSVLNTVDAGFRAITEPKATGRMNASKSMTNEFSRKVRTLLRGITTLFYKAKLLNIVKYGWFSFFLISHKLMRWLVPVFLFTILVSNYLLIDKPIYMILFSGQMLFYVLAVLSIPSNSVIGDSIIGKIPLFFLMVNLAIVKAWYLFFTGKRQEIWSPTKRDNNQ